MKNSSLIVYSQVFLILQFSVHFILFQDSLIVNYVYDKGHNPCVVVNLNNQNVKNCPTVHKKVTCQFKTLLNIFNMHFAFHFRRQKSLVLWQKLNLFFTPNPFLISIPYVKILDWTLCFDEKIFQMSTAISEIRHYR